MRNVRLLVPDQLHAKMHQMCSLAGVPLAAGYVILAAYMVDVADYERIVRILQERQHYLTLDQGPAVIREPAPVEA
jgi:hypothetical protein